MQVLSYGLKHSVTPKRIPTDDIVSRVESVLARQRELPESTKDDIRSRIASTLQSASLTDCNLTKDELHALRRLRNDKDIVTSRGQRTCYCCYGQEGLYGQSDN